MMIIWSQVLILKWSGYNFLSGFFHFGVDIQSMSSNVSVCICSLAGRSESVIDTQYQPFCNLNFVMHLYSDDIAVLCSNVLSTNLCVKSSSVELM